MNQNQDDGEKGDRRERRERRSQTLPFWNFRRLHGRRRVNRRAEQHNTLYFVERIPGHAFFMSVLLLICTIIDGLATIVLLDYGFEEANPLMRMVLKSGPHHFFAAKFLLTAMFLPVALVMYRYRLFNSQFRVGYLIPLVAVLYLILLAYQWSLWNQRHQPYPGMSRRPISSPDQGQQATRRVFS